MSNTATTSIPPPSSLGSGITDLLKFKILAGNTNGSDNGIFNVLLSLLTLVAMDLVTKHNSAVLEVCNQILQRIQTLLKYFIWHKIFRQTVFVPRFTVESFKFSITVEDRSIINLLMTKYVSKWNFEYRTDLILEDSRHSNYLKSYGFQIETNNPTQDAIYNALFFTGKHAIPVHRVGLNPQDWIYVSYVNTRYILSNNVSNQRLVDFLVDLKATTQIRSTTPLYISGSAYNTEIPLITNKTFSTLFFEQKEPLMRLLKTFQDANYYYIRGCPRHLTFLLTGYPGCGKTSFIKALAKHLNYHIYNFKITQKTTNLQFENTLRKKETIIVLEDFDRIETILKIMSTPTTDEKTFMSTRSLTRSALPQSTNQGLIDSCQKQLESIPMTTQDVQLRELWERYLTERDVAHKSSLLASYKEQLSLCDQQKNDLLDMQTMLNAMWYN